MQKKISVIIPVYNGEKYIDRCINSVLSQKGFNVNDLEILLINDGSKDGSLETLRHYESVYPSVIKVINQKNVGVARTRNKGIKLAAGEYIIFIDQDDYIDSFYCKIFYEAATKGGYDIVVGGYRRPNLLGKNIRTVRQINTEYSKKYKISAAWAKIHRTMFLIENNIEFYNNDYGEDIIFTMDENNRTNKILGINYIGYNWFLNSTSVSNTSQKGLKNDTKILKLIRDMTFTGNQLDEYYILQTGIYYLLFSGRTASSVDFIKLYNKIFKVFKINNQFYYYNKFIIFGPSGALLSVKIAISGFMLIHRLGLVGLFSKIYCNEES